MQPRSQKLGHMSESHEIYERVTTLEATVASLHDSVRGLTTTVAESNMSTAAAIGEIKTMLSSVGKTDGKTIITLGASLVGVMVMVGSIFLGPIQRDVSYLDKTISADSRRVDLANERYDEFVRRAAEMEGAQKLMDWRLRAIEEKRAGQW